MGDSEYRGSPWPRHVSDEEWERLNERQRGYLEGVWQYAWWKDGVANVGTTGRTFGQAVDVFLHEQGVRT